jgi:hypothetical protein
MFTQPQNHVANYSRNLNYNIFPFQKYNSIYINRASAILLKKEIIRKKKKKELQKLLPITHIFPPPTPNYCSQYPDKNNAKKTNKLPYISTAFCPEVRAFPPSPNFWFSANPAISTLLL